MMEIFSINLRIVYVYHIIEIIYICFAIIDQRHDYANMKIYILKFVKQVEEIM